MAFKKTETAEYPCLKECIPNNRIVVYFSDENTGVCFDHYDRRYIGSFGDNWAEEAFRPVSGTVTLDFVNGKIR